MLVPRSGVAQGHSSIRPWPKRWKSCWTRSVACCLQCDPAAYLSRISRTPIFTGGVLGTRTFGDYKLMRIVHDAADVTLESHYSTPESTA
jgi:hypothetical protein